MRRYNIIPLILFILSIINFALAAPVLIPGKCQMCANVAHVPKDVVPVLGKRGNVLEKLGELLDNNWRWDWEDLEIPEPSSAELSPSSSAPLETGHGSMEVDVPPSNPASWHPPTSNIASSTESDSEDESMPSLESLSDHDSEYESMPDLESLSDHDSEYESMPDLESLSGHDSGYESMPNLESLSDHDHEESDAPPPSPGSHSNSALTVANLGESLNAPAPSATSATGGVLPRGAGLSLPGLSDYLKSRNQSASRGSANPMDEDF